MTLVMRRLGPALALVLAVLLIAACGSSAETGGAVTASVLVEADKADPRWFVDLSLPDGGNGYELLEAAVQGDLEAQYFEEFGSHLVSSILGVEQTGGAFWIVFVWNEESAGWEPLTTGADGFTVQDGQVMGWALVELGERPSAPGIPPAESTQETS